MAQISALAKYIFTTRGKLFSFTQFKLELTVNQIVYAKNAVEWMDMMILKLSDGTYEIPAIVNTDAVRKAIGKPDLDLDAHVINNKKLLIKRSCLNVCRKKEGLTPYLFVLDFAVGETALGPKGGIDICQQEDVRKWVGTLRKDDAALYSANYDTIGLEKEVRYFQNQESVLEWVLSAKNEELEKDDEGEEDGISDAIEPMTQWPLVPLTFKDYLEQNDILWETLDGEEGLEEEKPAVQSEQTVGVEENVEENIEEDGEEEEAVGTDGQSIQEQLEIATVPRQRNRLLQKLRASYFTNNVHCSLHA